MPKKAAGPKTSTTRKQSSHSLAESESSKLDETRIFLEQAVQPALAPEDVEQYAKILNNRSVDVATLCMLDRADLKELGITDLVHTAWISQAAERAKSGQWRQRPPSPANGGPVIVYVKIGIGQLEVDSVSGLAHVKFFFDMYWYDRRLIGSSCGDLAETAWRPDAFVLNYKGEMNKEVLNSPPVLVDSETGKILCACLFHGQVANSQGGLKDFPYDEDDIMIEMLQTEDSNSEAFIFRPHDPAAQSVSLQGDLAKGLSEWVLRGFTVWGHESLGGNGVSYSHYSVSFHLRRMRFYYIYKVVLPMMIATIFCFTSFFFDTSDLSNRNNVAMTMFLATAALLLVLDSSLPKTDFLTMIDKYTLASIFVQAATSFLACVMGKSHSDGLGEELADMLNLIGAISLPSVYFLITLITFAPYEWRLWRQRPSDRPPYLEPGMEFYTPYALPKAKDEALVKGQSSLPSMPLIGKVNSTQSVTE